MPVVATGVVVDAIAIADVEAVLGAVAPDRTLHEPRKRRGEGRIELAGVDAWRRADRECQRTRRAGSSARRRDVGATAAAGSRFGAGNYGPGCRQPRTSRRLHATAAVACRRSAARTTAPSPRPCQQPRRRSAAARSWPPDRAAQPVRRLGIHCSQLLVDPADEIVIGNVAHEQEQAIRHLVEAAVPQRMAGQGAGIDVGRLRARMGPLMVPAVIKPPVPARASGTTAFATKLRRYPTSARDRAGRCTPTRPYRRSLESSGS